MQKLKILNMDLKNPNNIFRCMRKMGKVDYRTSEISSWIKDQDDFSIIMLQGEDAQKIGLRLEKSLDLDFYAADDNPTAILVRKDIPHYCIAALGDADELGSCVVLSLGGEFLSLFSVMLTDSKDINKFSNVFKKYTVPATQSFTRYQIVGGVFPSLESVDTVSSNHYLMDVSLEEDNDVSKKKNQFVSTVLLSTEIGYSDVRRDDTLVKQKVLKNSPITTTVFYK